MSEKITKELIYQLTIVSPEQAQELEDWFNLESGEQDE